MLVVYDAVGEQPPHRKDNGRQRERQAIRFNLHHGPHVALHGVAGRIQRYAGDVAVEVSFYGYHVII